MDRCVLFFPGAMSPYPSLGFEAKDSNWYKRLCISGCVLSALCGFADEPKRHWGTLCDAEAASPRELPFHITLSSLGMHVASTLELLSLAESVQGAAGS